MLFVLAYGLIFSILRKPALKRYVLWKGLYKYM